MDRQGDMMKLTVAAHNFANVPTKADQQNSFITRFFSPPPNVLQISNKAACCPSHPNSTLKIIQILMSSLLLCYSSE